MPCVIHQNKNLKKIERKEMKRLVGMSSVDRKKKILCDLFDIFFLFKSKQGYTFAFSVFPFMDIYSYIIYIIHPDKNLKKMKREKME